MTSHATRRRVAVFRMDSSVPSIAGMHKRVPTFSVDANVRLDNVVRIHVRAMQPSVSVIQICVRHVVHALTRQRRRLLARDNDVVMITLV